MAYRCDEVSGLHNVVIVPRYVTWCRPRIDQFFLNVDGSVMRNPLRASLGGLIRNLNGEMLKAFYGEVESDDIIFVEIMTLLLGVWELGIHDVT